VSQSYSVGGSCDTAVCYQYCSNLFSNVNEVTGAILRILKVSRQRASVASVFFYVVAQGTRIDRDLLLTTSVVQVEQSVHCVHVCVSGQS